MMVEKLNNHEAFCLGLYIGVLLLAALFMAQPARASEAEALAAIEAAAEELLSCDVTVHALEPLPELEGELSYEVSAPRRAGLWLPAQLRVYEGSRLKRSLSLKRYVEFELPIVVALCDIDSRSALDETSAGLELQRVAAGSEVLIELAAVLGSETQSRLRAGEPLKPSRLRRVFDLQRGAQVNLVIEKGGVSMNALAEALGNAYTGQSVYVRRLSDGQKYKGILTLSSEGILTVEAQ